VTRLVIAARYLTIVPIPGAAHSTEGPGVAAAWFPVVGLALGAVLVAVDRVAGAWFAPLLSAVLVVTAWKLVTGGLHLDGLADCLDGSMGRDAAHRLTIMRDSRIGAFGAIGLVLCLMLDVAAVSTIDGASRWRAARGAGHRPRRSGAARALLLSAGLGAGRGVPRGPSSGRAGRRLADRGGHGRCHARRARGNRVRGRRLCGAGLRRLHDAPPRGNQR
jgi:cobalamin synthase